MSRARKSRENVFCPVTLAIASSRKRACPDASIQPGDGGMPLSTSAAAARGAMKPILIETPATRPVCRKLLRDIGRLTTALYGFLGAHDHVLTRIRAGCSQELETCPGFGLEAPDFRRVLVPCGVLDAGMRVDASRRHELDRFAD